MTCQDPPHRPEPHPPAARWAPWRSRKPLDLLWLACVANFAVAWIVGAFVLGGDAFNGKVEDGRYFLLRPRGGVGGDRHVEVSAAAFTYSYWHVVSILVSWPFVMIYGCVQGLRDWAARRDAAGGDR